jgi:hypothetical protein
MGRPDVATVLARLGSRALVQLHGRDRLVDSHFVPDVQPGDDVLVGVGVLRRLSPAEAARLRHEAAAGSAPAPES